MNVKSKLSVPEGYTLVPNEALEWLNGAAPDADGKWFGELMPDPNETPRRAFWWRSKFRKMIEEGQR